MRLEILWMDLRRSQNFTFQKMLTFQLFSQYNTSVKGTPINKWLVSQTVLLGGGGVNFFLGRTSFSCNRKERAKIRYSEHGKNGQILLYAWVLYRTWGPLNPSFAEWFHFGSIWKAPLWNGDQKKSKKSESLVDKCGSNALTTTNLTFGKGNLSFPPKAKNSFGEKTWCIIL